MYPYQELRPFDCVSWVEYDAAMHVPTPSVEPLRLKLPNRTVAGRLKQGGFKTVYRASIGGQAETLKLVHVPKTSDYEADELVRKECL